MNDPTVGSEQVQSELVAYLDGELNAEDRHRVEDRLARDDAYRQKLNQLQRAWEMLDQLPRSTADATFAKTTVEMVAVSAAQDMETKAMAIQRHRQWGWLLGSGGFLIAAVLGYLTVSLWLARPDTQLLRDLPVIERFDLYRHADSVNFLERLDALKVIPDSALIEDSGSLFQTEDSLSVRKQKLNQVSSAQAEELRRNADRFLKLPREQKQHYRDLHRELSEHQDADSLQRLLVNYNEWLARLPRGKPVELMAKATDARLQEIQKLAGALERPDTRNFLDRPPSPEDGRKIAQFLDGWVKKHEAEIRNQIPLMARETLNHFPDETTRRLVMYARLVRLRRDNMGELPLPTRDELMPLISELSPEAQRMIAAAKANHEEGRLLQSWILAAIMFRSIGTVTEDELAKFYDHELSTEERARLDSLSRDAFPRELRRLYFEHQMKRKLQLERGSPLKNFAPPSGEPPRGNFGDGKNRPFKGERPERREPAPGRNE